MDRAVHAAARQCLHSGEAAIVVEVIAAQGSVPREAGTRMLVCTDRAIGTVGGGHLEWKAVQHAREMLRTGECAPRSEHYPLGPALGQCCGGAVTLGFSLLDQSVMSSWAERPPLFHLQLYGAGHVGRAVATLLAMLHVRVDWIDEREQEFPATTALGSAWPSHVRRVCVDAVEAEVDSTPPGAFFLVLTHQHDLDLRITEAILKRGDFGFLGVIGSRTKRQRFVHRFEARGISPDSIAKMVCPIGIEGIAGKEPEVIAVAVVAQLLQAHGSQHAASRERNEIFPHASTRSG